jgi:hypothetical protein
MAAELALRLTKPLEARSRFETASRLEPANPLHELNLAVLRLRATKATVAAQARATLNRLSTSTNLAEIALRWLVADRQGGQEWAGAFQACQQLLARPQAGQHDSRQHLGILQQLNRPGFEDLLAAT